MAEWIKEPISTRAAFGKAILECARDDERIVVVGNDSINSMALLKMQSEMPSRVINAGIAEQSAVNVAAGLAATGMKAVVAGFSVFISLRACEQVRTSVCYPNLDVTFVGSMSGLSASTNGVTHQALEDVGVMRLFPNMVVASAADVASTEVITKALVAHKGPAYLRIAMSNGYKVFDEGGYKFEIGRANLLKEGGDTTIVCNGSVVYRALEAAEQLAECGISARVLEMPCVKPLDEQALIDAAQTGAIVTVEDHQIIGGLGSAVTEFVSENCPTRIKRLGIKDVFTRSGDYYALMDHYGMAVSDIREAVRELCAKKKA